MMRLAFCVVLALVSATQLCTAELPATVSYHGVLRDASGGPVPDGPYQVTFRIYDAYEGGSSLWSETQTLPVRDGIFSTTLGDVTSMDLSFDIPYWLGISVEDEPEMTPRLEFTSVPYAFRSAVAESLKGSEAFADTSHVHDGRYYRKPILSGPGTINSPANPVDWTKLKNVPIGFADGTDDVGGTGDGHSLDASDGTPEDVVYVDTEGNVGVGTQTPGSLLDVAGTIRVSGFTMPSGSAEGQVLTSDSSGFGTWQEPAVVPDDDWMVSGNDLMRTTGNVLIGPSGLPPEDRLEVEGDVQLWAPEGESEVSLRVGGLTTSYTSAFPLSDARIGAGALLTLSSTYGLALDSSVVKFVSGDTEPAWAVFSRGTGGEVGIGTDQPDGTLDVRDDSGNWGHPYFLAQLEAETATVGLDRLLSIDMPEGSSDGSYFIACARTEGGTEYYKFRVTGSGSVVSASMFPDGGDFAAMMAVEEGARSVEPGDVLVIDTESPGGVAISRDPQSTLVAGVYSGTPGVVGQHQASLAEVGERDSRRYDLQYRASAYGEIPVAIVGIVRCNVSAENGPIRTGDLLVTSSTPGHAMREEAPRPGTILGKALGRLASGTGTIDVLLAPN